MIHVGMRQQHHICLDILRFVDCCGVTSKERIDNQRLAVHLNLNAGMAVVNDFHWLSLLFLYTHFNYERMN
ncbi:hypothetical protein D3C74_418960 [compost metagenome]